MGTIFVLARVLYIYMYIIRECTLQTRKRFVIVDSIFQLKFGAWLEILQA